MPRGWQKVDGMRHYCHYPSDHRRSTLSPMTYITDLLFTVLPLIAGSLALAFPVAVVARWVHSDNPGRPPARADDWVAGSLPSRPYALSRR